MDIKREQGFTLVEMLVALLIFGIVAASATPAFISHLRHNTAAEVRIGALAAAQRILDDLRVQNPASLPLSGSVVLTNLAGVSQHYSAQINYCLRNQFCGSASRHIELQIFHRGIEVYETETVFTQLR